MLRLSNPVQDQRRANIIKQARIAELVGRYKRDLEHRRQNDADTLASLVRAFSDPRGTAGADMETFKNIIREIVKKGN